MSHEKGCKFKWNLSQIYKEYLQILIVGFNSGKYDITFIISYMLNIQSVTLYQKVIHI